MWVQPATTTATTTLPISGQADGTQLSGWPQTDRFLSDLHVAVLRRDALHMLTFDLIPAAADRIARFGVDGQDHDYDDDEIVVRLGELRIVEDDDD